MTRFLDRFAWLSNHSRAIPVKGDHVSVLSSPLEYFTTLKDQIGRAKRSIFISSLYLGTDSHAKELVATIDNALGSNHSLECNILIDCLRGHRGSPNSRSLLQDLVDRHGNRFRLYMYHTPRLRGVLKKVVPERFNEVVGLQHTKINVFDDNVILTGANLAQEYFTIRRDRYVLFQNSPNLSGYFANLHQLICQHSFQAKGTKLEPPSATSDPLLSRKNAEIFTTSFREKMSAFIQETTNSHSSPEAETEDTLVYPLVQMGEYSIKQDQAAMLDLFSRMDPSERVCLASAYFNMPPQYLNAIVSSEGHYEIIAASPEANGFYNGRGLARHVPFMYVKIAQDFLKLLERERQGERIRYFEYCLEDFIFHCKGLWYYLADHTLPIMTLVGSSNYGYRSLTKDLEVQAAVVTGNPALRRALQEEQEKLMHHSKEWTLHSSLNELRRQPSFLVRVAARLLKPHI